MEKIFFISDAHLGAGERDEENYKEQKIISFFKYIQELNCRLFIVGDFFDLWFEYKNAIPNYYFNILRTLADLRDHNIEIDFIVGNHDCWVDNFFPDNLNIRIHRTALDIELQTKRVFIAHGHGILKNKRRDRIMKKIIEHPINIFLYRLLPPDLALPLAKNFSRLSRYHGATKINPEDARGLYIEYARDLLNNGYDAVVLGHTHNARLLHFNDGQYINLGDWITLFSYGLMEDGRFSLNYW